MAYDVASKFINAIEAWEKGSNPWVTIDNPNPKETNRRQIRVRMNDIKGGSFRDIQKRNNAKNAKAAAQD